MWERKFCRGIGWTIWTIVVERPVILMSGLLVTSHSAYCISASLYLISWPNRLRIPDARDRILLAAHHDGVLRVEVHFAEHRPFPPGFQHEHLVVVLAVDVQHLAALGTALGTACRR